MHSRVLIATALFLALIYGQAGPAHAVDLTNVGDPTTGAQFGVPRLMPGKASPTSMGINWKSDDKRLSIDSLRFPPERALQDIYQRLKSREGRRLTRDELTATGFLLEGLDRDGSEFIVRVVQGAADKRGLSIVFSKGGVELQATARQIAASFKLGAGAVPETRPQTLATTPPTAARPVIPPAPPVATNLIAGPAGKSQPTPAQPQPASAVSSLPGCQDAIAGARAMAAFSHAETALMVGDGARALVDRAFTARGLAADEAAQASFLADYTAHAAVESRPFPGAVACLQTMRDAGWRLTICTNKPAAPARALLAALDLERFFPVIGAGDSFPVKKPDPRHLRATLEAAGGSADRALMLGDHSNDVLAAIGAGVACVFAGWGYGPAAMATGAVAVARDFAEIPALAARLLPG